LFSLHGRRCHELVVDCFGAGDWHVLLLLRSRRILQLGKTRHPVKMIVVIVAVPVGRMVVDVAFLLSHGRAVVGDREVCRFLEELAALRQEY